jgi:hypothetical protein
MSGSRTLSFKITGDASDGIQAMGQMEHKTDVLGGVIAGFSASAGAAIGNFVTDAAGKLASFATDSVDLFTTMAGQTRKVMLTTGLTAEDSSRLVNIARLTGVEYNDLQDALKGLGNQLVGNQELFDTNGVKTRDLRGELLPMPEILGNIADKMVALGDGAEASALSQMMMEDAGVLLMPMLQMGKQGIADMSHELDKYGLTMDANGVAKAKEMTAAQAKMSMGWDGLQLQIGQALAGPLTDIYAWVGERMPAAIFVLKLWIHEHEKDFESWGNSVKNALKWVGENGPGILRGIADGLSWMKDRWDDVNYVIDTWSKWWTEHIGTFEDTRQGFLKIAEAAGWLGDKVLWVKDNVLDPVIGTLQKIAETANTVFQSDLFKELSNVAPGGAATGGEAANSGTWYGEALAGLRKGATTGGPLGALLGFEGFDDGGVVPGPIGAERIVKVHGGEEIIPRHNPTAMARRGDGEMVQVTSNIHIDGEKVATVVTKHQVRQQTAAGR